MRRISGTPSRAASIAAATLIGLSLVACDSSDTSRIAASSLDAATLAIFTTGTRAALRRDRGGEVDASFSLADLPRHPSDAATLTRFRYVRRSGRAYGFTPLARRASVVDCSNARGPCRGFRVGTIRFVRLRSARLETEELGGVHAVRVVADVRVVPTTALGSALARSTEMTCEIAGDERPWRGAATPGVAATYLETRSVMPDTTVAAVARNLVDPGRVSSSMPPTQNACPSYPHEFAEVGP